MCGIAGIIDFGGRPVDRETLVMMCDLLRHRGPDDAGIYLSNDGTAGMAHRRLSIIDLSSAGHQPMSNEDGTIWISFNGEIFNYRQLKQILVQQGHLFRSNCDTEVIVHLYEEYGVDCVSRLNGQFAFVIWDERNHLVLGARDHLGIKPLYYRWNGERFIFGSELKAILPAIEWAEIDNGALTDFLVLQYVPSPKTILRNVRKLEAGNCLIIREGNFQLRRYWNLQPSFHGGVSEERTMEMLDQKLRESVERQLVADVPLGVFLSGGLDSSAITYYMASLTKEPVNAYSVGFQEREYSELQFAEKAAASIPNVVHHQLVLKADDAFNLIQDLIDSLDEPFADQAIIPTYLMSRYAKETVTVCLSGEGSDEIFGGYSRYRKTLSKVQLLRELTRFSPALEPHIHEAIQLRYEDYIADLCSFHPRELPIITQREVRSSDDFVRTSFKDLYYGMSSADDLERVQRFDIQTYLADNLLFKVDRASMLASLEVRVPFLDFELVEFCLGLPFHLRYRSHLQKYALRKLMRNRLPDEILYRKKMGFSVPIYRWFQDAYYDYVRETLLSRSARARGIFRTDYVESMLDPRTLAGNQHNSLKLWCLLMVEEWCKRYLDALSILRS